MVEKDLDCVLCGSCVVDVLVRPVPLDQPIQRGRLIPVEPIEWSPGGIVSNAGIAMARLGMKVAAVSYVGRDEWASLIRRRYEQEGIETAALLTHPTEPTSASVVLVDEKGERSFAHCVGAPKRMNRGTFLNALEIFSRSRMMLVGYYSLMPELEPDLADVLARVRAAGCRTALDAAGDGGSLQPLDRILPHLDIYVPSRAEAVHQTGQEDPLRIIETYRRCGAEGLLGVKLGAEGALLSPAAGQFVEVRPVPPPGETIDTTGAGDAFYAGLLTGLLKGFDVDQAGRLAAAAGACCVAARGGSAGIRDFQQIARAAAGRSETPE